MMRMFVAIVETLEADVRSKFQTKRRMQDAQGGAAVPVPFDEALVKFLWKEERSLEICEVLLAKDALKDETIKLEEIDNEAGDYLSREDEDDNC